MWHNRDSASADKGKWYSVSITFTGWVSTLEGAQAVQHGSSAAYVDDEDVHVWAKVAGVLMKERWLAVRRRGAVVVATMELKDVRSLVGWWGGDVWVAEKGFGGCESDAGEGGERAGHVDR